MKKEETRYKKKSLLNEIKVCSLGNGTKSNKKKGGYMIDQYSFEDLYTQYKNKVVNYYLRKNLCFDIAEDLAQDVFEKLLKTSSVFEGRCKVSTYIMQIAKNRYIEYMRSKRTKFHTQTCNHELQDIHIHDLDTFEDVLIRREKIKIAKTLFEDLSDDLKELYLCRIHGTKMKDVAFKRGVKESRLKTRLFRSRAILKTKFDLLVG